MLDEEGFLDQLYKFQFVDYDLADDNNFIELFNSEYMGIKISPYPNVPIILELRTWVNGLMKLGILNMLEVPHFGRIPQVKMCPKMLLS